MTKKEVKQNHNNLKSAVVEYLEAKKYLVVNFYAGGGVKNGKYFPRKNTKGVSDIIALSPEGIFTALEIKIKPDCLSEAQAYFLAEVNNRGGKAEVIYNINDLNL